MEAIYARARIIVHVKTVGANVPIARGDPSKREMLILEVKLQILVV